MKIFEEIEKKFIVRLNEFNTESRAEYLVGFSSLWNDMDAYRKHIRKRIRNGDVENEYEYLLRTFETLASSDYAYIEVFLDETLDIWDRVFYSKENSWAVVIGENGKILTSYKIRDDIIDTLEKHKILFQSKYTRKVVSDEFSKRVTTIYERLTRI